MKWFFSAIAALFFPWVIFLSEGRILSMLLAMLLQISVVGWVVAIVWAWKTSSILSKQGKATKTKIMDKNE